MASVRSLFRLRRFVVLSVAEFEAVYAEGGELIQLPRRAGVSLAA